MVSKVNKDLISFLETCPTCFQVTSYVRDVLKDNNYTELVEGKKWDLKPNKKYFVVRNESSIIAFQLPKGKPTGFMIGASHSDSPSFKIKENPEIQSDGYIKLNVEKYGGMLCGPWFDRPLSVAGRVVLKKGKTIVTKKVCVDKDLVMIPSLAIHMNREANEKTSYNVQTDMPPILSQDTKVTLLDVIAKELKVLKQDIISHDLYLYDRQKGSIWGAHDEFLSAPHLDDLQCGFGNLYGFLQAKPTTSIPLLAIFDNEEVGSLTKQGADSTFLEDVLKRIHLTYFEDNDSYYQLIANSFMVSADNGHAVHPNFNQKADPTNRPKLNGGIVIKYHGGQKYTSDAISSSVFKTICTKANVPFQIFTNRSDMVGGSTLGNISNAHVSLNMVDIGMPQWAMHSPYETTGSKDTEYLIKAMKVFFSASFKDLGQGNYELDVM